MLRVTVTGNKPLSLGFKWVRLRGALMIRIGFGGYNPGAISYSYG